MDIKAAEHRTYEDEPEPSGKQFAEIYPYAFAMGLNKVWADEFNRELAQWARVAITDTSNHGNGLSNFEDSISSLETDLSRSAIYTPPSSSGSGSGGGW